MASDRRTDGELLAAAREDPEALGCFYDRHAPTVLAYFVRRTRSPELAAELAAETFARVVEHCRRGRAVEAPLAWLYTIALHQLADLERRGRVNDRARRRLGLERLELADGDLERIDSLGSDPQIAELPAALAELSEDERAAVLARHVDERSYAEIAAAHHTTEPAARKRVSRAVARLRRRLEESRP